MSRIGCYLGDRTITSYYRQKLRDRIDVCNLPIDPLITYAGTTNTRDYLKLMAGQLVQAHKCIILVDTISIEIQKHRGYPGPLINLIKEHMSVYDFVSQYRGCSAILRYSIMGMDRTDDFYFTNTIKGKIVSSIHSSTWDIVEKVFKPLHGSLNGVALRRPVINKLLRHLTDNWLLPSSYIVPPKRREPVRLPRIKSTPDIRKNLKDQ